MNVECSILNKRVSFHENLFQNLKLTHVSLVLPDFIHQLELRQVNRHDQKTGGIFSLKPVGVCQLYRSGALQG